MAKIEEKYFRRLLSEAGITVNGPRPYDIQVYNKAFYRRVLLKGSLGLGEAYMDRWWDCGKIDEFICRVLKAGLGKGVKFSFPFFMNILKSIFYNLQSVSRAFQVGERHYDIGSDLFESMLGETMAYSCAYWQEASTLDEAQRAKLDLICRKIHLKKGDEILDIGCGWGSFAKFAAENYGARVTGITVSKEQALYASQKCLNLPVVIKLLDYRNLSGRFDHVVSVGMFEHVGYKNYRTFMGVVDKCLKDEGFFLLHTIGHLESTTTTDPWINKYIFPNGMIPSLRQIKEAVDESLFLLDIHGFGPDYDRTLMAWYENFINSWPELKSKYGERFFRMWKYYLLSCAGSFRVGENRLWQIVLSKQLGNYQAIR